MKTSSTLLLRVLLFGQLMFMLTTETKAQAPMSLPTIQNGNEPSDLKQLRQQFTLRALTSTRMLADQYTKALSVLEDQASLSGDYETALATQQRRQKLAAWYAIVPADNTDAIILRPADAKITGSVAFNRKDGILDSWRSTNSSASWDILKLTPGTYNVTMTYGAANMWDGEFRPFGFGMPENAQPAAGEVELSEVTGLSGAEAEKLTVQVRPTGGWTEYETTNIGDLKLVRTSARLTLKVSRLRGTSGLMHLREIRLTPSRAATVKVDNTASKEYAEEHQSHLERLTELGQPIVESYLARLQSISDDLAEKKDDDGVQSLLSESKRAQQSLHLLGKEKIPEPGIANIRPDGFEEIQDARYVPDPTNTGDRFLVSTKNQIITVRLMTVSCPSPRAEDEDNHKRHSTYFGITMDDSFALGRQAQEFTDTYLKDKPLRLLTRWKRDKNGSILAIVQPGEVGNFSGILVDNGLAAISPPRAKLNEGKRMEEAMIASLKERETAAKAKALPPGAWSFLPANPKP